jgi:hypothetical protein
MEIETKSAGHGIAWDDDLQGMHGDLTAIAAGL